MSTTNVGPMISIRSYPNGKHGMIMLNEEHIILTREQLLRFASQIYEVVNDLDMKAAQWFYAVPGPLSLIPYRHLMRKSNLDARGSAICGMAPSKFSGETWNIIPLTTQISDNVCKICLGIYRREQAENTEG